MTSRWPMYSSRLRGRRVPSTARSASSSRSAARIRWRRRSSPELYHDRRPFRTPVLHPSRAPGSPRAASCSRGAGRPQCRDMAGPEGGTGELQAGASPRPSPSGSPTRGFLFADLRDYTRFVEGHGAADAAELLARYRAIVRQAVAEHRRRRDQDRGRQLLRRVPGRQRGGPVRSGDRRRGRRRIGPDGTTRAGRSRSASGSTPARRSRPPTATSARRSTSPPGSARSPGPAKSSSATPSGR